jgi:nicotinamidase-related amidase
MFARDVMPGAYRVAAEPYDYTFDLENTALVIIDMQADFCAPGGYIDQLGYDISLTARAVEPIRTVLATARQMGMLVIHTREGHRADLSDLPFNKRWRSQRAGAGIGDRGPLGRILVRGEPGWQIIPQLAPIDGEPVIDKPGKGSFYATDLELLLHRRAISHLLEDCTGATDESNHHAALKMITMQGGLFGAIAPSAALLASLGGWSDASGRSAQPSAQHVGVDV